MLLQGFKIFKWIYLAKITGVDKAHEKIANVSAMFGLVKQGVFPVKDSLFKRLLTQVVVKRSFGHTQEQCQLLPVFKHVRNRLP